MATWDSYTQKATPEDNDTLMIKDTAGGANQRTPFSGVWNWIVKKLASAVISQLETTNKSIIPAINELNSKSLILNNTQCSKISENDDLNEYTTPGTYNCLDSATAKTLENAPYESAGFFLYVLRFGSSTFKQIAIPTVLDEIKMRTCNSGTWSAEWRQLKPIT